MNKFSLFLVLKRGVMVFGGGMSINQIFINIDTY